MNLRPKRLTLLALSMTLLSVAHAQLVAKTKCPDFYVDVLNGTVNELKSTNTPDEIKAKFPCFSNATDETTDTKCGGQIVYKDKDIRFYTKRYYIEIGPKFLGKLSVPLLGAKRNSLFKWLGNPKIKDDLWDAFEMQYGTLVLHYDVAGVAGKIKMIQISTQSTETLSLCD